MIRVHYIHMAHWLIGNKNIIPAPTQSLLQKWLREKHDIHVNPIPNFKTTWNQYHLGIVYKNKESKVDIEVIKDNKDFNKLFESYEEVLEVGL